MGFGVTVRIPRGTGGSEYRLDVGQTNPGGSTQTAPPPDAGPAVQGAFGMSGTTLVILGVIAFVLFRRGI